MDAEVQAELQALLSFLTRDAKVPLAVALPKYTVLKKQGLTTPGAIAKSDLAVLKPIFNDDKIVKQVHNAAKRLSNPRKRAAPATQFSPSKQPRTETDQEAALSLPSCDLPISELRTMVIETNRAPLFLAFAYTVANFTLDGQPLSSRLSIAQAVTSAGAQSKAKYIGLTNSTAEDEGWAQGQPKLKLMGREVAVMRRHISTPVKVEHEVPGKDEILDRSPAVQSIDLPASHEAFWGIDLEALRRSNGPLVGGKAPGETGPPIHKPDGARAYLLKSIDLVELADETTLDQPSQVLQSSSAKSKKLTPAQKAARREQAVAMLLKAIHHVCESWASTLTNDELDRRANSWYANVRPEVQDGQAGWGQRGRVSLKTILDLAKPI